MRIFALLVFAALVGTGLFIFLNQEKEAVSAPSEVVTEQVKQDESLLPPPSALFEPDEALVSNDIEQTEPLDSVSPEVTFKEGPKEESDSDIKALNVVRPKSGSTEYVEKYALIVGITDYKDDRLDLRFSARDAEALYEKIQTPTCGAFRKDNILFLKDEDATTRNVTRALRSFLKKPKENDLVLLYFSCHGAPDPDRKENVYLLTHDTEPKDIAGTALPMREINAALSDNLRASKVVLFADTCHSASIGPALGLKAENSAEQNAVVSRYSQKLGESRDGIALLTSSEAAEVSREGERWGGGHGVFTHFILEGVDGKADNQPRDGIVSLGELFEFVRSNVQKETNGAQNPVIGPNAFDRRLPMAVTGGVDSREHYELGLALLRLAHFTDQKERARSAAREFGEAIRLSMLNGSPFPEATFGLGLAQMTAGDYVQAMESFNSVRLDPASEQKRILALSQCLTLTGNAAEAYAQIEQNAPRSAATQLAESVAKDVLERGNVHLIAVGIDDYPQPVSGCVNDAFLVAVTLQDKIPGLQYDLLLNKEATVQGIYEAIERAGESLSSNDLLVFTFSGYGTRTPDSQGSVTEKTGGALVCSGVHPDRLEPSHLINDFDLRIALDRCSARKLVILDTSHAGAFVDTFADSARSLLIAGCSPEEMGAESSFQGRSYGAFTYRFFSALRSQEVNSLSEVLHSVSTGLGRQSPMMSRHSSVEIDKKFFNRGSSSLLPFLHYFGLPSAPMKSREDVTNFSSLVDSSPELELQNEELVKLVSALSELGAYQTASTILSTPVNASRFKEVAGDETLETTTSILSSLSGSPCKALLIGIDAYDSEKIGSAKGSISGVATIQKALIKGGLCREDDIVTLVGGQATKAAILDNIGKMADSSGAGLLYFAGKGTRIFRNLSTRSFGIEEDALITSDLLSLRLNEIEQILPDSFSLTSILECGFTPGNERHAPFEQELEPATRGISATIRATTDYRLHESRLLCGDVTIVTRRTGTDLTTFLAEVLSTPESKGLVAGDLIKLVTVPPSEDEKESPSLLPVNKELTPLDIIEQASSSNEGEGDASSLYFTLYCEDLDTPIGRSSPLKLERTFTTVLNERVYPKISRACIQSLGLMQDRFSGLSSERLIDLACAYEVAGDLDQAMSHLSWAIKLSEDGRSPEAHYHYGRLLYQTGADISRGMSELELAQSQAAEFESLATNELRALIELHLGHAIVALIKGSLNRRARDAYNRYLQSGDPFHQRDQVTKIMEELTHPSTDR